MQVHQHQLLVAALNGQVTDQQAALQIGRAHRPGEGTGQGNALRTVNGVIRGGEHAAVHLADGRQGEGDEGAGVVQGVGGVGPGKKGALVNAVCTGGVGVHLLQHDQIRGVLAVQQLRYIQQVGFHPDPVRGFHVLAAVHEEVRVAAQTRITDVPAQHRQALPLGQGRGVFVKGGEVQFFHSIRLIFRNAQPGDQPGGRRHDHQDDDEQHFKKSFHRIDLHLSFNRHYYNRILSY